MSPGNTGSPAGHWAADQCRAVDLLLPPPHQCGLLGGPPGLVPRTLPGLAQKEERVLWCLRPESATIKPVTLQTNEFLCVLNYKMEKDTCVAMQCIKQLALCRHAINRTHEVKKKHHLSPGLLQNHSNESKHAKLVQKKEGRKVRVSVM